MTDKLIIALPSKGRLMDETIKMIANAGYIIEKDGGERRYNGKVSGYDTIEILFLSASEIAGNLRKGSIHMGVTGEDLIWENIPDFNKHIEIVKKLGFGNADVVVCVPDSWIDVNTMSDLDDVSIDFYQHHGSHIRVATKYISITRSFFAEKGVTGYRIVESQGATEGAPANGTAELIVDITSTGKTLRANHLKILTDGVILKSEAVLAINDNAWISPEAKKTMNKLVKELNKL